MKTIQIDTSTFRGDQFAALYSLNPLRDFFVRVEGGVNVLYFPDSLPSNPTIVFPKIPTEEEKIAQVKQSALFDDAAWAALTNAQRADKLREWMQKILKYMIREAL